MWRRLASWARGSKSDLAAQHRDMALAKVDPAGRINLSSRIAGLAERASLCLLRSRALVNRPLYQ